MRARWPWILALLVVAAIPLTQFWRSTIAKHQEREGRRLAALALGPGREVAYEGRQKVLTRDEKNRLLAAEATKLTSTGGVSKLEYHGGELDGRQRSCTRDWSRRRMDAVKRSGCRSFARARASARWMRAAGSRRCSCRGRC